ncbi:YggS family pyridoxal phosphate-dependent enzyme [Candidatus Pelagibacter bacterium nBUS_49]|uniref:YggS family pyridoxal phosphate-dependent enzyme n=1 Tax=Candidatus Pelagibacter bacterium nBUS_49 TaxID=3374196 RepID=UPI003EB996CF
MHISVQNLINIENEIKLNLSGLNNINLPNIIAVSKTFKKDSILPLIEYGHRDFGENKIQEAIEKWTEIKIKKPELKLHMIGKLQTNKVKLAVRLFDFIHSVDSEKLAKKIFDEQSKIKKKIKIFIQVNIGNETQKSGVDQTLTKNLILFCKELGLDVIGLMCIPPANIDPNNYFNKMNELNLSFNFSELSMGMSSDYLKAARNNSTYLRIGSRIFGQRI